MTDIARSIAIETEQAKHVLYAVAASISDDDQALVDTVEGETNLLEAIDRGLVRIGEMDAMVIGLKAHIEGLKARIERFEKGDERIRKAMLAAMQAMGQLKLERSLATLSVRAKPQGVIEFNIDLVPSDYLVPQPPRLDKAKASKEMRGGVRIPGLGLTEPAVTLHIR